MKLHLVKSTKLVLAFWLAICVSLTVLPAPTAKAQQSLTYYNAVVERVVDGDTVNLSYPVLGTTKVRLLSIDTPETNFRGQSQGYHAERATSYLKSLLPVGTKIRVAVGAESTDQYGRLLAHIFKGKLNVNEDLVKKGHAVTYFIWPNDTFIQQYQKSQEQAKRSGLGIWDPTNPLDELPFEFRMTISNGVPNKFVGDYTKKTYVVPSQYTRVDVSKRIFFLTEQDAIDAGFRKVR
ncbi:thermonuclease family protein [Paenibacillus sp. 481]|uniref:thermonuclease family protein n=1 Tax=Paenibacillus sp. 481 TaxID=2835869 RepID=UPI001E5B98D0|nr:thermonuclease family protein [Paenibacillus sp. 481]UHA71930.1 thermonuclease family protein [Paenibacillus sp. 481]